MNFTECAVALLRVLEVPICGIFIAERFRSSVECANSNPRTHNGVESVLVGFEVCRTCEALSSWQRRCDARELPLQQIFDERPLCK